MTGVCAGTGIKEFLILILCLVTLQCRGSREASVVKIDGASRTSLPLRIEELVGLRDGETVDIEAKFLANMEVGNDNKASGPDSLILQIKMQFAVPIRFRAGSFSWHQNDALLQGPLTSTSVAYYGGQGALPSMAGQFQFSISGHGDYEVIIPSTEIVRP